MSEYRKKERRSKAPATKNLLIWGAGGHGRVVLDIARSMGDFGHIAFFDNRIGLPAQLAGLDVLSGDLCGVWQLGFDMFIVAIGPNMVRAERFREALEAGLEPATCIHSTAWISPGAVIGRGTVVMPRVVIQTDSRVGEDCIVNTGAIVEHDCIVGDHVHLSPGVTLCGNVMIGPFAHLGASVTAIPGATVGDGAVVGAGAVVLGEIPRGATAVGVPARVIRGDDSGSSRK